MYLVLFTDGCFQTYSNIGTLFIDNQQFFSGEYSSGEQSTFEATKVQSITNILGVIIYDNK